jgi:hypothetical protein
MNPKSMGGARGVVQSHIHLPDEGIIKSRSYLAGLTVRTNTIPKISRNATSQAREQVSAFGS